jgi:hypothetical protein
MLPLASKPMSLTCHSGKPGTLLANEVCVGSLPNAMNNDAMIRGVAAAVLARIDEVLVPLRGLLAESRPQEGLAGNYMRLHHEQSIEEMRVQGYKTNDIVEIGDNILDVLKASRVSVNGTSIDLEVRELLTLFGMVRQAQSQARERTRVRGAEARFTSVATLLEEIERAKAEAKLEGLWQYAIDTDVHKAISSLRRKLAVAGLNRNLIEGKRGSGYRLSTPHWNLITPAAGDER